MYVARQHKVPTAGFSAKPLLREVRKHKFPKSCTAGTSDNRKLQKVALSGSPEA